MSPNDRATIRFEPTGHTISVPVGSTLLAAARAAGLAIDAPCGGLGRCGSCRVRAEGDLEVPGPDELELLGGAGVAAGKRLACRARVRGSSTVTLDELPRDARVVTAAQVRQLELQPPSARGIEGLGTLAGAAIDVGTTTIALVLLDLRSGVTLASAGELNAQRIYGADVLSRVAHASASGIGELQRLAASQLETMLLEAARSAGLTADQLVEVVVSGNTAMTGLLLGRDVSMLGAAPYAGAPTTAARVPARELGMFAFPTLDILTLPGASAFIGCDIIAGMLATGLAERVAPTIFIDLGTNGELVLAARGGLVAASTAAGPALEGASIECGMRAEAGAIERVRFADGRLSLGVIGEVAPVGMCGSGLIDLVAALLDAGVLDASGRFVEPADGAMRARLTERDGVRTFVVDADADIYLTQKDVRQVQLAIGAVRTGIGMLLDELKLEPDAITTAIVAGGFGYHLRASSLARIGLIPPVWTERVAFAGNTALGGATMALVNAEVRGRANAVAARVRTLDLAARPEFQQRFVDALTFPR